MIDVNGKKQIVVDELESRKLRNEFEEMFIYADDDTPRGAYSSESIKSKYPTVYDLYKLVCL